MAGTKRQSTPTGSARALKKARDASDIAGVQPSLRTDSAQSAEPASSDSTPSESSSTGAKDEQYSADSSEQLKEGMLATVDDYDVVCVSTAKVEDMFPGNPEVVQRLKKLIQSTGAFPLATNLATVNPDLLEGRLNTHVVCAPGTTSSSKAVVFTIYAVAIFVSLDLSAAPNAFSKQFGFAPFHPRWGRSTAVLRRCFGQKYLLTRTYRSALVAQSSSKIVALPTVTADGNDKGKPSDDKGKGRPSDEKANAGKKKKPEIPFRPTLPKNWNVPLYDGRKPFSWRRYEELPSLQPSQVVEGMACAVLCTITAYKTGLRTNAKIDKAHVKASLTFNLLGVVVLEDPDPSRNMQNLNSWAPDLTGVLPDPSLDIADCTDVGGIEAPPTLEDVHGDDEII